MPQWTEQQNKAISENGNLLVSAAAGAGKTAVLTARIVKKIREGTPVKALLVVTFTKAAAGEMKKRINKTLLQEAAREGDEALRERLHDAAEQVQNASISTLHSFCTQVLRRHFYEAGIDPAFRVADGAEAAILLEDALDSLFENRAQEEAFCALLEAFGGEEKLSSAMRQLYAFMQAQCDSAKWLHEAVESYNTDEAALASSPLSASVLDSAKRRLKGACEMQAGVCKQLETLYPEAAVFGRGELSALLPILDEEDYAAYGAKLSTVVFGRLSGFPRGTLDADKKPLKDARKAVSDAVKAQAKLFSRPLGEEAERMRALYPLLCELERRILEMDALYAEAKRARGLIDYADMEHMSLALLSRKEIGEEYRRAFRYIFVDEYQDSNRLQEAILSSIKRADNLFMVGDVKQSIYGFRQAEPTLFMEKYAEPASFSGKVIDLNQNFRSARAVVDTVNAVFERVMQEGFGGTVYDERAALGFGRTDAATGAAELYMLPAAVEDEELEVAEVEARFAAKRIREIMERELYTDPATGEVRPYRFSDFAILHRAPKRAAERMTRMLAQQGVPAYAELSGGYFEAVEVQVFLNLLRILDNRRQDIPLVSVLRSEIGGFSDEELASLRAAAPAPDMPWLDILSAAAQGADALAQKAEAFLQKLDLWHEDSRLLGLCELCGKLLDETGYGEYCAALPGGRVRRANLEALLGKAQSYEQGETRSLSGFIAFMDRVKNTDTMGAATAFGADVVRLLSTHKSKGLEFPVVFVAGLSKLFNMQDSKSDLALHPELGLGLRLRQDRRRIDTLARQAIIEENAFASLEEEARILYVAMTRARERLILLITKKDIPAEIYKHAQALSPTLVTRARSASDWLLWALLSTAAGDPLREIAGLSRSGGVEIAALRCALGDAGGKEEKAAAAWSAFRESAQSADASSYDERLAWEYPHLADTRAPGKISVSELIGNFRNLRPYPDFIAAAKELQAADRGTAAHLVMETIPLQEQTQESVRAHIAALVEQGRLNEAQAATVQIGMIVDFFASPLGKRILACKESVERERKFNYRVPAREIGVADSDEPILLQGVIDCCFLEDDAWVVLDYKTDRVGADRSAWEAVQKHKRQIGIYAAALHALTEKPVKAAYIYLLRTGDCVEMDL